jgi:hypothetical protein
LVAKSAPRFELHGMADVFFDLLKRHGRSLRISNTSCM